MRERVGWESTSNGGRKTAFRAYAQEVGRGASKRMGTEISVHDNELVSYTVQCEERQIRLHTIYRDREPYEYTDVVFTDVVAYHFETDNFQTILFDIAEVAVEAVYTTYRDLFVRKKNYGWPVFDYKTEQDLLETLREQGIKGFVIASSYGMEGFVLAKAMQRVETEQGGNLGRVGRS
jgi:hypothetical protein